MSKIMLVEDDKSLREIYSIRLVAEGYDVVSAGDGEEALAIAVQEKPDLVLSDVMMPKISGFDMLDILRSTPETKDIKVIMMTALSSDEQRQRGESLGANKYLVKSQVGIEDVINAVHEVLADSNGAPAQAEAAQPVEAQPVVAQAQVEARPVVQPQTEAQPAMQPQVETQPVAAQPQPQPAQPQPQPAQPAETPQMSSTSDQMEAALNQATEAQNAWPGTAGQ